MRPIDAERLDRIMTAAAVNDKNSHLGVWKKAIGLVHDAPTVNIIGMDTLAQLAKRARWVNAMFEDKGGSVSCYRCSGCGTEYLFNKKENFCPNCGARMDQA